MAVCGMAIVAMEQRGMAILAMHVRGQDARATSLQGFCVVCPTIPRNYP